MKYLLKVEEATTFALSIYLLTLLDINFSWWVYILLYLAPDIGMIGYAFNNKFGAITYNISHHKAVAVAFILSGMATGNQYLTLTGILLFGHAAMDRMMGYGLKHFTGFKYTHLGKL